MREKTMIGKITACAAVILLSCSFGVKGRSPSEPEGEQEPATEADASAPASVSNEMDPSTLLEIGACWFESPYEYMFSGAQSVSVGDRSFGSFLAGISGVLYYGDLNECFGRLTGSPPTSYSDNSPFEKVSGLDIYSEKMDETQPFGFYNPEIVEWGHKNLIPSPSSDIAGVPAQKLYDAVFSRFFRMMTESRLYLVESGTYRQEMDAYWKMAAFSNQDGIDYLQARYQSALPQYGGSWDGTTMTPQMAIGFWIRRGLDGTSAELWTGLSKAMKIYDKTWYDSLKTTYRSTDIEW
jgi:hypothetical protein